MVEFKKKIIIHQTLKDVGEECEKCGGKLKVFLNTAAGSIMMYQCVNCEAFETFTTSTGLRLLDNNRRFC